MLNGTISRNRVGLRYELGAEPTQDALAISGNDEDEAQCVSACVAAPDAPDVPAVISPPD